MRAAVGGVAFVPAACEKGQHSELGSRKRAKTCCQGTAAGSCAASGTASAGCPAGKGNGEMAVESEICTVLRDTTGRSNEGLPKAIRIVT